MGRKTNKVYLKIDEIVVEVRNSATNLAGLRSVYMEGGDQFQGIYLPNWFQEIRQQVPPVLLILKRNEHKPRAIQYLYDIQISKHKLSRISILGGEVEKRIQPRLAIKRGMFQEGGVLNDISVTVLPFGRRRLLQPRYYI